MALLCIDFVNDIVSPQGKLTPRGYLDFVTEHDTLVGVRSLQDRCRAAGITVIHVHVGFDDAQLTYPSRSPLFGAVARAGGLRLGTWGTQFAPAVAPLPGELVIHKPRVSAFHGTLLEPVLRAAGVTDLVITGVATDLAVQTAVREAHDRDFAVVVPGDCCAAGSEEDHIAALRLLTKIAHTTTKDDLAL